MAIRGVYFTHANAVVVTRKMLDVTFPRTGGLAAVWAKNGVTKSATALIAIGEILHSSRVPLASALGECLLFQP